MDRFECNYPVAESIHWKIVIENVQSVIDDVKSENI